MAYEPRPAGPWVDGLSDLIAADMNRIEANGLDASERITALSDPLPIFVGPPSGGDDTAMLLDALAAAKVAGGGEVRLRAGQYGTTTFLGVPHATTLAGAGKGATIIRALPGLASAPGPQGGYTVLGQDPDAFAGITVRDLTVDGNRAALGITTATADRESSGVVDFRFQGGLQLLNVEVRDGWYYHLAVWDSADVLIRGCTTLGPGTSGVVDQCDGIHLTGVERVTVEGCTVRMGDGTDGDDGIAVRCFPGGEPVTDVTIVGNNVNGGFNGSGISLISTDRTLTGVTISGNVVRDCAVDGIATWWYDAFTGIIRDVAIVGNVIRDCGRSIKLGMTGQTPPYRNFEVSGNVLSRSGAAQQASTTNSVQINIRNNTVGTT